MAEVHFDFKKCSKCGDPLLNCGGLADGECWPECGKQYFLDDYLKRKSK